MTQPSESRSTPLSCARAQVLLEMALDQELDSRREAQFRAHLAGCASCREEFETARRVQGGLRQLAAISCPETVAAAVRAVVEAEEARREGWMTALRRRWEVAWRPTLAVVGVAATATVIALLARPPAQPVSDAAAVAQAEEEVLWALAYVADVTRRASDDALDRTLGAVMGNVIGRQVVVPVTDAVGKSLEEE